MPTEPRAGRGALCIGGGGGTFCSTCGGNLGGGGGGGGTVEEGPKECGVEGVGGTLSGVGVVVTCDETGSLAIHVA